jgi:hypothetical protein
MMAEGVGKWAFLIGVLLALIAGIGAGIGAGFADNAWITALLVIAGLVVGFVNITVKETQAFLVAAVAVMVASTANLAELFPGFTTIGLILAGIVAKLIIVVAPAALLVALRAVYGFAAE